MAEAEAPGSAPGTALEVDELMADVLEDVRRRPRDRSVASFETGLIGLMLSCEWRVVSNGGLGVG